MEILDDQQLDPVAEEQLASPIFIKRLKYFSIVTLIHSIVLFVLSILFIAFYFLLNDFIITETVLLFYSSAFALLGAFLLFRTYQFTNQYRKKTSDLALLNKGMNHFFIFWLALTFGFITMIIYLLHFGF